MMQDQTLKTPFLIGIAVFTLMVAFVYTANQILSPILIGILLIFVLSSLKENPFANRLRYTVIILLFLWIFIRAQAVFFPFIVAFTLSYILDPAVQFFERRRIPRTLASLVLIIILFGLIVVMGKILIPNFKGELGKFKTSLSDISTAIQTIIDKILKIFGITKVQFKETLNDALKNIFDKLSENKFGIPGFLGQLINIIIIPVLTFYILKDFNRIRQWFLSMFPKRRRPRVSYYLWRINRIIGGYLRAQIFISMMVGIFTGIGLALCHIQYAVLLGVLTGLLNFIPYIGLYVSLAVALLVAFLDPHPILSVVKVAAVFFVVQGVENAILQPKIVGDRVGMHPVAVVFSVLFCAKFFGFWGLIMGVPAASVIMFFLDEWRRKRSLLEMIEEGAYKNK